MLWKLFFMKITTENGNSFIDDTHREKALSNKTPALMKSMNMDIWVIGTSNKFIVRGS